ncbi:hypothetical protein [Helicobacter canis]|nr:hypothetical protein [Helicobacter canis]
MTKQDEAICDSSPKANATSEKVDSRILSSKEILCVSHLGPSITK